MTCTVCILPNSQPRAFEELWLFFPTQDPPNYIA